jgi:DNA-binding XRE family transcriptional regulator
VPTVISPAPCVVESIGARLRRIRTMRGWTQVQLAEQSELLQHTISQIESGAQKGECMQLATAPGAPPTPPIVPQELSPIVPSPEQSFRALQEALRLGIWDYAQGIGYNRNGYLALKNHQLRGLDHPRKRACLTAIHNCFLTRADGTTAAERFFGQKPRAMFAAILASVAMIPPAPLSPPQRAIG